MFRFAIAFSAFMLVLSAPATATEAGWALLREGGQVVLMRHARAPGTGDPARLDIEDCRTQRNLSDQGRQQARRIGALFAARSAPLEKVLTSRFCRARDTALLAFGDRLVEEFEALDYFPDDPEGQEERNRTVLETALDFAGSDNLVMITHEETIEALLGVRAREGEALILAREEDGVRVAARITFN